MCDCENCQCHSTLNGPIRIRHLEGREYFVVPAVLLTEGVHNGSNGPIFYPLQELNQTAHLWAGKAVIVYHPTNGASASNPDVFDRQRIGYIFNSRMDGPRLIADLWIDVVRVRTVDSRIYEAITKNERVEVSTGLISALVPGIGTFNGRQFRYTVQNIYPDHLAILPDMKGACSTADGCGMLVNGKVPVLMPKARFVPSLFPQAPKSSVRVLMPESVLSSLPDSIQALMPKPIQVLKPKPKPVQVLKSETPKRRRPKSKRLKRSKRRK